MNDTFATKLVAAIRELVADNPNFCYTPPDEDEMRCVYQHDGVGSCLIGQAALRAGIELDVLEAADDNAVGASELLEALSVDDTHLGVWADTLQTRQDQRQPWHLALFAADQYSQEVFGRVP